jgi:membrane associated rhomboid family serine protease
VIGASGAVAGVLGAYIVVWPRARVVTLLILGFFFPVVPMPAWILLGMWLLLQAVQGALSLGGDTGVAYFAHVGGFVTGMLLVWVFAAGKLRRHGRTA